MLLYESLGTNFYLKNIDSLENLNKTLVSIRNQLPVDILWIDQSYMEDYDAFSFDAKKLNPNILYSIT